MRDRTRGIPAWQVSYATLAVATADMTAAEARELEDRLHHAIRSADGAHREGHAGKVCQRFTGKRCVAGELADEIFTLWADVSWDRSALETRPALVALIN